jgi:hypothetical protein
MFKHVLYVKTVKNHFLKVQGQEIAFGPDP